MQPYPHRLPGSTGLRSWVQRALLGVVAVGVAILAAFFLSVALIAGAFIALAIGVRFWWTLRKFRKQAKATEALEGEYKVVDGADTREHLER